MALALRVMKRAPTARASVVDGEKPVARAVPTSIISIKTRVGRTTPSSLPQTTGQPARGILFSSHSDSPSRPKLCKARLPLKIIVYMTRTVTRGAAVELR